MVIGWAALAHAAGRRGDLPARYAYTRRGCARTETTNRGDRAETPVLVSSASMDWRSLRKLAGFLGSHPIPDVVGLRGTIGRDYGREVPDLWSEAERQATRRMVVNALQNRSVTVVKIRPREALIAGPLRGGSASTEGPDVCGRHEGTRGATLNVCGASAQSRRSPGLLVNTIGIMPLRHGDESERPGSAAIIGNRPYSSIIGDGAEWRCRASWRRICSPTSATIQRSGIGMRMGRMEYFRLIA